MADKLTSMTDAQLSKEGARLAAERTAVRLRQNDVRDEVGARRAATMLPEGVMQRIAVSGSVGSRGQTRSSN